MSVPKRRRKQSKPRRSAAPRRARRFLARCKSFPWRLFLLASGALLTLHWCAGSSENYFSTGDSHAGEFALISLVLFLVLSFAAYWARHSFHGARSIAHHPSGEQPKTALVFCVSAQNLELAPQPDGSLLLQARNKEGKVTKELRLTRKDQQRDGRTQPAIRVDIEKLDELGFPWSWQQLLRGLEPHLKTVRRIHLIGSADSAKGGHGSHRLLGECRRFLAGYTKPDEVKFITHHPAQDFENFKQLAALFDRIIKHEREEGSADRDIAIDITGGLKPVSVAGAMATLNNDVAVQYVQTNWPWRAYLYDLLYLAKPELH
ncbi:MAG: hypothetical protein H7A45_10040 [Verrucomicrobiales bacterium]|nr:hypothetical protein [Verrucomicrobiales bacterium]MCP5528614.1 hypothetical protein [Verrucomicrobiales bacterium]